MNESPSLPKGVKDPLARGHVGGLSNGVPGKRMAPQPPTNGKNGPLASLALSMPPCTPSTWASPHSFVLSSSPAPHDGTRPMVNGTNTSPSTNWILSNMRHEQNWNGTVKRSPHQPSPSLDSPCSTPKQTRGLSSLLNDTSQGSCDTTPATPDSLIGSSSLICSDEDGNNSHNTTVLQARQQTASSSGIHLSCSPSSSLTSPPFELATAASVWRGSNSNLSSQQQRDNLIEEVTTPVPMCSNNNNSHSNNNNNNFLISCSSSSAPSSPSTSSRAGSLSSPASPMSPFRPFHHDTGTIKRNGGTLLRHPSKHQAPPAKMYVSLYPEMSVPATYGRTNGLREPQLDRESLIKRSNSNQHMNGNQTGSTSSINYHHHYRHVPPEFVCAQQKKTGTHHNERRGGGGGGGGGGGSNICHYATIQRRSHGQNNVCGTSSSTNNSLMHEPEPVSSNGCNPGAGGSSSLASRTTNAYNRLPSTRSHDLPLSDVRTLASSVSIEGHANSNNSVPSFSARTSNNDLHLTIQALQQQQLLTQKKAQVNCRGQRDKFSQPQGFNRNQSRSRSTSSSSSSSSAGSIASHGSESDTDKDVYALEEKIRKQSSFPSLFQSRPFKKPPFTIESAMSAVYQKKNKNKKKPSNGCDVSQATNDLILSSPFAHRDDSQNNSNHISHSSKASLQNNADLQDSSLMSVTQIQSIQQELINQHSIATLGPSEPSDPPPLLPTSVSSNQDGKSRGKRPRKDARAIPGLTPGGSNHHSLIPGDLTASTTAIPQSQEEVRGGKWGQGSKAPVSAHHMSSILARLKISGDPVNGREGLIQDQQPSLHPSYQAALERKERLDEIKSVEESDPMLIDSNSSLSPPANSPLPPPLPAKNATTLSTIAQVNSQEIKGNGHVLRRSMDREAKIPLISKEPTPFSAAEDDVNEETETGDGDDTDHRKRRKRRHLRRKNGEKERQKDKQDPNGIDPDDDGRNDNEDLVENEMEYCDPCYCYGKCCLDVVASIFCVSLL